MLRLFAVVKDIMLARVHAMREEVRRFLESLGIQNFFVICNCIERISNDIAMSFAHF